MYLGSFIRCLDGTYIAWSTFRQLYKSSSLDENKMDDNFFQAFKFRLIIYVVVKMTNWNLSPFTHTVRG